MIGSGKEATEEMAAEQSRSADSATFVTGGLAGFIATVPMTIVMLVLHRLLPAHEQYDLPPEQITKSVANKVDAEEASRDPVSNILAGIAHFGFGATAGAFYAPFARLVRLPFLLTGLIYGMLVWFSSYEGWLPRARILPPASRSPVRRNLLMIAAHLVWGSVLAWLVQNWAAENQQGS